MVLASGTDFQATDVRYDLTGTSFELSARGRSFLVRLPLIGDFNVYNSACRHRRRSCAGIESAGEHQSSQDRAAGARQAGACDRERSDCRCLSITRTRPMPWSMCCAHSALCGPKRIITVFGCGGDRDRTKRPKMARAAEDGSDICVLTSDNPRTEDPAAIIADATEGLHPHRPSRDR